MLGNGDMGAHYEKPTQQSLVVTIGKTRNFRVKIQVSAGDDSEPILGASVASKSSLHLTCCASSSGEACAPTNVSEEKKETKHARLRHHAWEKKKQSLLHFQRNWLRTNNPSAFNVLERQC
ncbi:hypothetical protein DY000_02018392 [Brassica cretica]|uniref:Uncharacterized protein n=1 Tax=Brassica cretica TaxID=69181 RepID=A0ABQ7D1W2_BRACR|nr:hypothetical protein DY000_02018392 [Brassica cretica]